MFAMYKTDKMIEQKGYPRNLKLNGVEYILLKIYGNPGCSQRFLRSELNRYKNGPEYTSSENYAMYFRRCSRYRDRFWTDVAPADVVDHMPWSGTWEYRKPKRSQMMLTIEGHRRVQEIIVKLGLK